jgi:hypothetical protein
MIDINSALLQAYYEAINALDIPVYEGEEPDNVAHKIYAVLTNISTTDTSTKNSSDVNATIQVIVNSWDFKYNNSKSLNSAVNQIISAISSSQNNVLDLSDYGLQMLNLSVNTETQNYGNLDGRIYISRIITFKQDIFII